MSAPRQLAFCLAASLLACGDDATPGGESAGTQDPAAFEAARNEAFRMADSGAALPALRDALLAAHALDPTAFGVNKRLGGVFADLKLHTESLRHYQAARTARPDDAEVLLKVVTLQAQLGLEQEALQLLPELIRAEGMQGEALYLNARILDRQGDRQAALQLVAQADRLDPRLGYRAQSLHGRFRLQAGELQAAHERFTRALQGRADYKEALKGLADTSGRLGRLDEARHWTEVLSLVLALTDDVFARKRKQRRETLERLVEIHPDWAGGFQQLADLQRRAEDMDAACRTIEAYLERHGGDLPAEERQRLRARFCRSRNP